MPPAVESSVKYLKSDEAQHAVDETAILLETAFGDGPVSWHWT